MKIVKKILKFKVSIIRFFFYHFGSTATKNGKESEKFKASEGPAAEIFMYKWGIPPRIYENLSHNPKDSKVVKGIKYE